MHNVRREKPGSVSAEALAAERAHEQHRLETYKAVEEAFLAQRREHAHTNEALESTTAILSCNPEHYTAWNYRRDILLRMLADASVLEKQRLLHGDLELTQQSMRTHPKVYWLWNHRRWCLEALPEDDDGTVATKWRRELALADLMLDMDPRNSDAQVGAACPVPPFPASLSCAALPVREKAALVALAKAELQYTLRKIESNFSNFSAWHYRTKLLPRVWDAESLEGDALEAAREREFELVTQAMYTDPSDQSIWIYHRWLVAQAPTRRVLEAQIKLIAELAELEPDSKWCLQSLAHYKQELLSRFAEQMDTRTAEAVRAETAGLFRRLATIDPLRAQRYRDLEHGGGAEIRTSDE
ncbi:protein geranylgeranyltransferase type II [Malassezia sp. CBS 17886]|nr:protein geranylgeranyltransferase type II [Malassezia sp. CBS 17886]